MGPVYTGTTYLDQDSDSNHSVCEWVNSTPGKRARICACTFGEDFLAALERWPDYTGHPFGLNQLAALRISLHLDQKQHLNTTDLNPPLEVGGFESTSRGGWI